MKNYHMKVVTKRVLGGWQIVVVGGDFLRVGARMVGSGIFLDGKIAAPLTFSTRSAARTELRLYMERLPFVKITGGLH